MAKLKPAKVPFDAVTGNLLEIKPHHGQPHVIWRDNAPFHASFTFDSVSPDRHIILRDDQDRQFKVFMTDFEDMMHRQGFTGNRITGTFVYSARGPRFGVRLAP